MIWYASFKPGASDLQALLKPRGREQRVEYDGTRLLRNRTKGNHLVCRHNCCRAIFAIPRITKSTRKLVRTRSLSCLSVTSGIPLPDAVAHDRRDVVWNPHFVAGSGSGSVSGALGCGSSCGSLTGSSSGSTTTVRIGSPICISLPPRSHSLTASPPVGSFEA